MEEGAGAAAGPLSGVTTASSYVGGASSLLISCCTESYITFDKIIEINPTTADGDQIIEY